ncbi:MAG TPA: 50S ribosomal protein L1, partial [Candidatus Diapherotrites archaeon]|nr:50S ribosomal protein L1 [Candidatus Diapherotrites archaeon]
ILAVGKYLGQQLAPRGKMPKPIQPSINSFEEMISKSSTSLNVSNKKGKFMPLVHVTVGREKDEDRKVADNVIAVFNAVVQGLEKREQNIKSVYLKLSMG